MSAFASSPSSLHSPTSPVLALLFDVWHGVAGDMILGALVDLGLDREIWQTALVESGLPMTAVHFTRVDRAGISATHALVTPEPQAPTRTYRELDHAIAACLLPDAVKAQSRDILRRLGEAEAKVHGIDLEAVHFHEIGAIDTLIDIVGACLGFHLLGITRFFATALPFGKGPVVMEHGAWREPVPATVHLAQGFPVRYTQEKGEMCTPTGTAIVTTLAEPLKKGLEATLVKTGYGAGTRNPKETPNVLRLCQLELAAHQAVHPHFSIGSDAQEAYEVACNIDNMTPEHIAFLTEALFASGAVDVWQSPAAMKKGRMGMILGAICSPHDLPRIAQTLAKHALVGGFRFHKVQRMIAQKTGTDLDSAYGAIAAKQVQWPEQGYVLPEADAVSRVVRETGEPWHVVYRSALQAAENSKRQVQEPAGLAREKGV
jgi:pyridinium-3,5-bisthiocarboxylic acid mononucleotide nickel chelatase